MTVKILAADDSETMRKVLEMTFAGESVEIETVDSGEAAVERARQSCPSIVIADVSMTMDGYEVARALKSDPATQAVPVLVLTSQHEDYDAGRGADAGVDGNVVKPFDSQVLIDTVTELCKATPVAAQKPAAAPAEAPRPLGLSPTTQASTPASAGSSLTAKASNSFSSRPTTKPTTGSSEGAQSSAGSKQAAGGVAGMASGLADLGLTKEQIEGVLALSRDVIEQVVWEVVPDLAEVLIREEIQRLTAE